MILLSFNKNIYNKNMNVRTGARERVKTVIGKGSKKINKIYIYIFLKVILYKKF